jgi:hypothetical protein
MPTAMNSDQVNGKTIRLSWTDGPTKGSTQEHIFHKDGTVEWHAVSGERFKETSDKAKPAAAERTSAEGTSAEATGSKSAADKPKYADEKIADGMRMISYLSKSGYTLTLVLNFHDGSTTGVASNDKTWMPVHGRFEVVH